MPAYFYDATHRALHEADEERLRRAVEEDDHAGIWNLQSLAERWSKGPPTWEAMRAA